jgi:hypothetical protein
MSHQDRINLAKNPSDPRNWDGRSNKEAIDRWSERAHQESKLAPRAKGGSVELPTTGAVKLHNTAERHADPRAEAKRDLNHDKANEYMRDVRRIT